MSIETSEPLVIPVDHEPQVRSKIAAAWEVALTDQGHADVYESGLALYASMYDQKAARRMDAGHLAAEALGAFWRPYSSQNSTPDRDTFAATVRDTIYRDGSPASTLYSGARSNLETIQTSTNGEVIAWTQGEVPHQIAKLAGGNIAVQGYDDQTPQAMPTLDSARVILQAVIGEDKFGTAELARLRELIGDKQAFVVEDRPGNILRLQQHIPGIIGIWAMQGKHATRAMREYQNGQNSVLAEALYRKQIIQLGRIAELPQMLDSLDIQGVFDHTKPFAIIHDVDGCVFDTDRRMKAQCDAVQSTLVARQWI